jgi:hypothetical protein
MVAVFRAGTETLTKPFKTVTLAPDSLDVRTYQDPELLVRLVLENPLGLARDLLGNSQNGLEAAQLRRRIEELGGDGAMAEEWWSATESQLRQADDVLAPSTEDGPWQLKSMGPKARSGTLILEELIAKRLPPTKRKSLCQELSHAAAAGVVSPAEQVAAACLGCPLPGVQPAQLAAIDPADLSSAVVRVLLGQTSPPALSFVVAAAVQTRDTWATREAADLAHKLGSVAEVSWLMAERIDAARRELDQTQDLDAVPDVAARIRGLIVACRRLIVDGSLTPALVRAALLLHTTARVKGSQSRDVLDLLRSVDELLSTDRLDQQIIVEVLREQPVSSVSDERLGVVLTSRPLEPASARSMYLDALVAAGRWRAAASEQAWRDVSLGQLAALYHTPFVSELLKRGAEGRSGLTSVVSNAVIRHAGRALAEVVSEPALLSLCSPALVERLVSSLRDNEPELNTLFETMARPAMDAELARRAGQEAHRDKDHAHREAALMADINQLRSDRDRLAEQLEVLKSQIRNEASIAVAASTAELRQGRIDGASIAADLLAEVERWSSRHPDVSATLEALVSVAARHGIHRIGSPGSVVPFDPAIHRMVSGDPSERVSVVESGWAVAIGADRVTARYAVVVSAGEGTR